jgi:microsomal dipeptidase-like Zn-dependent dipeptidase/CubicO group peptidase (beta-lactamase class C family)
MIAAYEAVDEGKLSLDDRIELTADDKVPGSGILTTHFSPGTTISLRDAIRLMMVFSDNTATNLVLDKLGLSTTNECMQALGCNETRINAKVYRRDTSIDPEQSQKYGLGSTTAQDMIKLCELLHDHKLVNETASEQMLAHLFACADKQKVPRLLPDGTRVAHKTGSVNASRTDAGIMETPGGPIAFCILTTNNKDESWTDDNEGDLFCAEVGSAVYQYFNSTGDAPVAPVARVLQMGAEGELVESLQRTLNARIMPSPGIGVDGDFGPETEKAVKQFQTQAGLEANGIVSSDTWKVLGPLLTEDEPAPEPAVVNAEKWEQRPADALDGPPFVTAKAWAIVDGQSGKFLAGDNEDERRDPASTTKIMTAYLVTRLAEEEPDVLKEVVTFSERADKTPGSTSGLKSGEQVGVGELLYGLMLPSGNDAAVALGEHFGERLAAKNENHPSADESADALQSFVDAMNQAAKELGMESTHFDNPHGLPTEDHQTTAHDLARLAFEAFQQPLFRKIVSTPQHGTTVDSVTGYRRNVVWRNTNQLLRTEGYDGIKTGTTGAAGCCLVSTNERDGRRMIVVVLGATSTEARYADTRNLFRFAWNELVATGSADTKQSAEEAAEPTAAERQPIVLADAARELHQRSLVVDGHNDLPWEIRTQGNSSFTKLDISQPQPALHTDIPRLREGGVDAQFWSVWVPVDFGYRGEALATTLEQIELVKSMIARYPETFALALSTSDIERIVAEGKIASLIGVEGGHCIEESLSALRKLYELGARYMTLTHSDTLSWADAGTDDARHGGLTPFGEQVVRTMNELGMLVDLSHVSPQTMHDALDVTSAPVIFSHSSARAVADHPRNVPDDVLERLKENGGVVMVNFFSGFIVPRATDITKEGMEVERKLKSEIDDPERVAREMRRWYRQHRYPRGTIHDLLDHIDHIAKVAGADHVGLGSDFDGISVLPQQLDDVSYFPLITQGLIDRGYTEAQIQDILGGNLMRVFHRAEAVAQKSKEN